MNTSPSRYSTLTISLHWLMLLLMIAVYATIELRVMFPKGAPPREAIKALHFMLGLCVLLLVVPRLVARLFGTTPAIQPPMSGLMTFAAKGAHLALYGLMIGVPILGWMVLSASGKPIPFFGLNLPALMAENKALGKELKEIHEVVGTLGYYLIGLHALAALYHHYVKRDNTLVRMLPGG